MAIREDVNIKVSADTAEALQAWRDIENGPKALEAALKKIGELEQSSSSKWASALTGIVGRWVVTRRPIWSKCSNYKASLASSEVAIRQRPSHRFYARARANLRRLVSEIWAAWQSRYCGRSRASSCRWYKSMSSSLLWSVRQVTAIRRDYPCGLLCAATRETLGGRGRNFARSSTRTFGRAKPNDWANSRAAALGWPLPART